MISGDDDFYKDPDFDAKAKTINYLKDENKTLSDIKLETLDRLKIYGRLKE